MKKPKNLLTYSSAVLYLAFGVFVEIRQYWFHFKLIIGPQVW